MKIIKQLLLTLSILGLSIGSSYGQVNDSKSKELYKFIVKPYLSLVDQILQENDDEARRILIDLCDTGKITIDNDFCEKAGCVGFANAEDYINVLAATRQDAETYKDFDIKIDKNQSEMMFCEGNGFYHVWIHKTTSYDYLKPNTTIRTPEEIDIWLHLKIKRIKKEYKIVEITKEQKPADSDEDNVPNIMIGTTECDRCQSTTSRQEVNIAGCLNNDRDEDGIPNSIDRCPDQFGSKNAQGCPDKDNDGVTDSLDWCPKSRGSNPNHGCPLTGMLVSVTAGGIMPVKTPFASTSILNNQTYQWNNNSSLAKVGIQYNASLQFHFSTWMGIEIGGTNFTTNYDSYRLQLSIEAFFAKNNTKYNYVAVNSDAYQFNLLYCKLSFGKFLTRYHAFKFEPMLAKAFNGFTQNETNLQIDYDNTNHQVTKLAFRTSPFLLYGASVKYEHWRKSSSYGFTVSGTYLRGLPNFNTQQIHFTNSSEMIVFKNQLIQLIGASFGFQFHLTSHKRTYR